MFEGIPSPLIWIAFSLISGALLFLLSDWLTEKQRQYAFVARWVIIPYLGLVDGSLSPTLMGLSNIDRLVSMGLGIGLLFAVVALLILVRVSIPAPILPSSNPPATSTTNHYHALPRRVSFDWKWNLQAVLVAGAEEFQWVFLRGAIWEVLLFWPMLTSLPAYTAVWSAAILALPESLLRVRDGWARFLQIVTLTVTSVLFFYTRNFWLCFSIHAIILLIYQPRTAEG